MHHPFVEHHGQRKLSHVYGIQEVFDNLQGSAIRNAFVQGVHALDRHFVLLEHPCIYTDFRNVGVNLVQGIHNAERHLRPVYGINGFGNVVVKGVVLFGNELPQGFVQVMPGQEPFLVIHGLQGILVISPRRPYRQGIVDLFPEGHLGKGFLAVFGIHQRIGLADRTARRNIICNWSLSRSTGG